MRLGGFLYGTDVAKEASSSPDVPASRAAGETDLAKTPAMRQYLEQKASVRDAILLFRMGDFYETFYDDAKTIARVLGLTLTARNRNDPNPIPLAGVPHHAVDSYVAKLVRAGFKVAISEQVEDPKTAKSVVRREVVRIITPGTLTDESLLEQHSANWLAAVCVDAPPRTRRGDGSAAGDDAPGGARRGQSHERVGLACVELSSGRFFAQMLTASELLDELARVRPAEVLMAEAPIDRPDRLAEAIREMSGAVVTTRGAHAFEAVSAERTLCRQFGVARMDGFGFERFDASLRAAGAMVDYLLETQKGALSHVVRIEARVRDEFLVIDPATLRSLEIERTIRDGSRHGSLVAAVDRTVNPMGARRLRDWLCFPLRDASAIGRRQAAIGDLLSERARLARVRTILREIGDLERIAGRVGVRRAGPRDLAGLAKSFERFAALDAEIGEARAASTSDAADLLSGLRSRLTGFEPLADTLRGALRDDAPPTTRDGGFIAAGFDAELDRLRAIGTEGQRWLAEYQAEQAARTGIPSLKVGYNQVFGYYIEVTNAHGDKVPPDYVRKQTVRNAERYITDALKQFENEAMSASERGLARELELFERLLDATTPHLPALTQAASALADLDVLCGLASLAIERDYCRPEVVETSREPAGPATKRGAWSLEIDDGRHPVLEQTLSERFVPNDCRLSAGGDRLLIITGPNMAGKSTYIRQVALLVLLAQTGSYVPARSMRFSPADRLFARVGASDELARGQSTFMVEMVETARILHNATSASLVILDEIGRGTSTFDGLALAWAITEHLARRVGCRTLFATHYHELTELAATCRGVANYNVAVRERRGDEPGEEVVFLHRIVPGGTDKSYGIHVARMAGVPPTVVARAREVLGELEQSFATESRRVAGTTDAADDSRLFPEVPPPPAWWEALSEEVSRLDLDRTAPIDALRVLQEIQQRLREGRGVKGREA